MCEINKENTPFVAGKISGRKVWKIEFKKVRYVWGEPEHTYYRDFEILMDPKNGQFLRVYSLDKDAGCPNTRPEPPNEKPKKWFGKLVESKPKFGFVYALSCCILANPSKAKVIRAILIEKQTTGRRDKYPVWYIIMHDHEEQPPSSRPVIHDTLGKLIQTPEPPKCGYIYEMRVDAEIGRLEGTRVH